MGRKVPLKKPKTDERTGCEVIRDAYLDQAPGSTTHVPQLGLGPTLITVGHGGWFTPVFLPEVEDLDDADGE